MPSRSLSHCLEMAEQSPELILWVEFLDSTFLYQKVSVLHWDTTTARLSFIINSQEIFLKIYFNHHDNHLFLLSKKNSDTLALSGKYLDEDLSAQLLSSLKILLDFDTLDAKEAQLLVRRRWPVLPMDALYSQSPALCTVLSQIRHAAYQGFIEIVIREPGIVTMDLNYLRDRKFQCAYDGINLKISWKPE